MNTSQDLRLKADYTRIHMDSLGFTGIIPEGQIHCVFFPISEFCTFNEAKSPQIKTAF